ncbi:hypothetical protein N6H14_03280 [Paenibacillus sp. CC-CFT747]|nr:hypothetical protein N6H14_03280 [Paenibacillus sp. CC-CFT747]
MNQMEGSYNLLLVFLSVLLAVLSSYTAIDIVKRGSLPARGVDWPGWRPAPV